MKKKIKADNVEQLMEIVRAIQNGEEPEEALQRKEAESAPVADSPKSRPETRTSRKEKTKKAGRQNESKQAEDWPEDDRPKQAEGWAKGERPKQAEDWPEDDEPKQAKDWLKDYRIDNDPTENDDFEDDDFEENLEADARAGLNLKPVLNVLGAGVETLSGLFGSLRRKPEKKKDKPDELDENTSISEIFDEADEEPERDIAEKSEDELVLDRLLDGVDRDVSSGEDGQELPEEESGGLSERKGAGPTERKSDSRKAAKQPLLQGIKDAFGDFRENLGQKGIHQKELFMIGAGAILVILIIALVVNGVTSSIDEKKKSEHVTADEGLTVTVENEPEKWCSSYPVELRFRVRGAAISKITVDGTAYTPDEQGKITVNAADYLMKASVSTDQGELNAQIEIPMIDAQAPVVNVARDEDKVSVTAVDARSSVTGIWYAAVKQNAFLDIPLYRKYSEPVAFEKNTTYYFYAVDAAGNRSEIMATTMEMATELTLKSEKISLYPGETSYLQLVESPAGALLNNLKYESANPEVVTVDSSGAVTATGEGSTVVSVSADGVETVSCAVEVSKERTVTISAIGDCTLGTDESFNTDTSFNAFDAVNGHAYFFQNVKEILENDDATFANLEGTFTTETTREAKEYAFKGDPSYTEILKNGSVEVVTLANNHSSDYGEKSLSDTKQYLEEADIDYCIGDEIALRDVNGIKTAFIGIYVLNDGMARESQVRETIEAAKAQGAQLIIMGFHWGSERETQPDETQQSLAHTAVDCGADLVVGHHPHVLQGIENYKGKYIVYSLGNFCFGGNSTPSDMDTMIFRQTFSVGQDGVLPESKIEIIPCSISSASGYNNYQPMMVQGAEAERIIDRVNEYSSVYGQSFTASSGLE